MKKEKESFYCPIKDGTCPREGASIWEKEKVTFVTDRCIFWNSDNDFCKVERYLTRGGRY